MPSARVIESLERMFGRPLPEDFGVRHDMGSGFLISRDGDILTSDHVVADADDINHDYGGQHGRADKCPSQRAEVTRRRRVCGNERREQQSWRGRDQHGGWQQVGT